MLRSLLAGTPPRPLSPVRAAACVVLGFGALALADAVLGPWFFRLPSVTALAARTLWGVGSLALCGVAFAVLVGLAWLVADALARRRARRSGGAPPVVRWLLLATLSTGVACTFLPDALDLAAHTLAGDRFGPAMRILFMVAAGAGVATLAWLGHLVSGRRWLRWLPIAAALFGMYENHVVLPDDYPELHAALGWGVAVLLGFAASEALDPVAARHHVRRSLTAITVGLAAFALLVPAPNEVRLHLFRSPASGAWPLGMTVWRLPELPPPVAPPRSVEWFRPRDGLPSIPPTTRDTGTDAPLVLLITVDAFRGDLLRDPSLDPLWPTLARLRDESVYFRHARSPGSQTAVSMSTLFSGRYFSQLRWSKYGVRSARLDFPVLDPAVRFPALLSAAGVGTFKVATVRALANEYGLASGFAEEVVVPPDRSLALAKQALPPLLDELARVDERPRFLFTHLIEPHGPYNGGGPRLRTVLEHRHRVAPHIPSLYLGALIAVDAALSKVLKVLAEPALAQRTMLIVSADHGEAFGEHGYFEHAKSLHEELLDVPLLVRAPGVRARVVDEPVGLIDLGPTILDWFGQPTPAAFMGQSLVPLVLERPYALTRPLLAEGRLRRTLVLDGLKLIVDERRKVMEAYDLATDPRETRNLWSSDRSRLGDVSAALRAFFDAHTFRGDGYRPVFRR